METSRCSAAASCRHSGWWESVCVCVCLCVCVHARARAVEAWQWGRAWTISATMAIGKQEQKHRWWIISHPRDSALDPSRSCLSLSRPATVPPRVNILPRPKCVSLWVLEGKFVEIIRFPEPNICLCFKGTPQANRDGAKQNTPESGVWSGAASLNLLFLRKGNLFKISF